MGDKFCGVLRMPYEMAMEDELSRRQFYSSAQEAAERVRFLEAELKLVRGAYGSAGAYRNGTPNIRAQIDAAIEQANKLMTQARESRDRRKTDVPYQADGIPDRRTGDRRARNRG